MPNPILRKEKTFCLGALIRWRLSLAFNSKTALAIIITKRLKELEIPAKLVFPYHVLPDTQRTSFIPVKLLTTDMMSDDVLMASPCLWNGITELWWEVWGVLCWCMRVHTMLSFFCLSCKLTLANNIFFSYFLSYDVLPFLSTVLPSFPPCPSYTLPTTRYAMPSSC